MKNLKELFEIAKASMEQQKDFVFVTVIASSGSTPRGAGSRMLVLPDGTSFGTIGGGSVEHTSVLEAQKALTEKKSSCRAYRLRENQAADLGMICGGDVSLYFQYISWENQDFYQLCSRLLADWNKNENSWLLLDITEETAWQSGYYQENSGLWGLSVSNPAPLLKPNAAQAVLDGRRYYSEPLVRKGMVYIFGGGHVAQELVPLLTHLEFSCTVFDDREHFSSPRLFPAAAKCITGDFTRLSDYFEITPEDYVCIMTRGHQYDYLVQQQVLKTPAKYIGVMGSKRKKAIIREKLLHDGFTPEELARITTPIGLNIQAETPSEIAVSIAGELIQIRAKNG